MTLKEKILFSSEKIRFTLYKEGLFYKCYNEDAMLFVKKVRDYKVNNKFVKSTGSNVFSIGFPASEIEKRKLSFDEISTKIESESFELKNELVIFHL